MDKDTLMNENSPDPEDFFSDSLQMLYDYTPITHSSPGSVFRYSPPNDILPSTFPSCSITLTTPTTQAANWSLHASSIWASSIYLADHLSDLQLIRHIEGGPIAKHTKDHHAPRKLRVLELGAGAGLPSILIAKLHEDVDVVISDYPDEGVIKALQTNVERNSVAQRCRVVPYAWGSDSSILYQPGTSDDHGFDVIIAADTLWNSQSHPLFLDTLHQTLRRSVDARIYLVAGLHTGRYTLQAFINAVPGYQFEFQGIEERAVNGSERRTWDVGREENDDEKERRRWVVWMVLAWAENVL
ncbi:putative methyltransferase-domain-containing protein [Irpex rosettiformis]|uniref:Methyltransferase-domain-containing protein n=1 Tax=Irpex rosettiformis TaxID=378272 RepID=A0ACB8UB32_9APHY|nr:putative methyltransferase-domain-containing protein [Irpex rosettiformis]